MSAPMAEPAGTRWQFGQAFVTVWLQQGIPSTWPGIRALKSSSRC